MSEFQPDFSSPKALIASQRAHAEELRARARAAPDSENQKRLENLAIDADDLADLLAEELAKGNFDP